MPTIQPTNATGTRDYLPRDLVRRNRVFTLLRETFERYGYEPLETPAVENTAVLEGKYGEEGEKLLFRILRRGQSLEKAAAQIGAHSAGASAGGAEGAEGPENAASLSRLLSDEALRYDLTVPFARVIAAHQNELTFPFRRYQMQPVWRADRPQRGRFREFYQCDVDCVGSASVSVEAEMLAMVSRVFTRLGFRDFTIRVNHRKLLGALLESEGVPEGLRTGALVSIDKLDKIGAEKVRGELEGWGVPPDVSERLLAAASITGTPEEVVRRLRAETRLGASESGSAALAELADFFGYLAAMGVPPEHYAFDISTVRGLSYYTGIIYETYAPGASVGSLCSGGRYDELIGQFTGRSLPCVGVSFGIDRIFTAMDLLGLSADEAATATQVLVTLLGKANIAASFQVASALRAAGIRTEVYADEARPLKAQLTFANKKGIPLVAIIGDAEREGGIATVKQMRSGEQETLAVDAAVARARALLGVAD